MFEEEVVPALCDEAHPTEQCPHFPLSREHHEDITPRRTAHARKPTNSKASCKNWLLNGSAFYVGTASAAGCNCLIDIFKKLLWAAQFGTICANNTQHTSPQASNYLEPNIVWQNLLLTFDKDPARKRIFALSD